MSELLLDGCRPAPLGSYLQALGLLRVVTRTLDGEALGRWEGQRFLLTSRFGSIGELVEELSVRFEPEAIVSPWNAGSGFAANGKNVSAEKALREIRESTDPRLVRLGEAVSAGDRVVVSGRAKGWGGKGDDLWDKARKQEVLQLCRNTFPDAALAWGDAAVALGGDADPTYSRLLGTGGNFGRQDLSATYVQRALAVLSDRRGADWLRAAVTGDETVPYLRDSVGQFDPARSGGIQSSPWEKADDKGFVNPWSFLLTIEGALLFAGAVVRRLGAQFSRPSLPFQVRGSTAGFASSASGESALGEIWVPEWSEPARLDEVRHLLAEGRAEWRGSPARSGLDFARAVANLGVDRGVRAFTRHVFVDRLGQNPLAVPAGRVVVTERAGIGLLSELDPWLARLSGDKVPTGVAARERRVEQRLFDLAAGRGGLVEVFEAVGALVEAVSRSGAARQASYPLELPKGAELLNELRKSADDDLELRIALALVTAQDPVTPPEVLRPMLQPVVWQGRRRWQWSGKAAPAPLSAGLGAALAEVSRRRAFPGAVKELETDREFGVRGSRVTPTRGVLSGAPDRYVFARGGFDEDRTTNLLAGLLSVSWPPLDRTSLKSGPPEPPNPALDMLAIFTTADVDELAVRPGANWPTLLAAGRSNEVLIDAQRRLVIAGRRFVVRPRVSLGAPHLLAASLLLRTTAADRSRALDRVSRPDEEKTA
ncbi:MAG: type I-G CRISPR-associated protein Cas8g1/Csx17 [Pseudonocardia sp.]